MSLLDALRHRLRPLLRRRAFEREMDEEFRHHLDLQAQELAGGAEAAARARARFGSLAYYLEETRRMTSLGWLDALSQDLRYAGRNLRRTPAFTTVAVLSLAIGIGANTAIFSLLYSLLLQPLPVAHPGQLVEVQHTGRAGPTDLFSYDEYRSLRHSAGFSSLTALAGTGRVPIAVGDVRRSVSVDAVDGNFFSTLGLRPLRGRLIAPEDERSRAPVVVISEDLWTELFNRAPAAIGATITIRGAAFTVIGVVPLAFRGLAYPGSFDAAVPLATLALAGGPALETGGAGAARVLIVGRLVDRARAPAVAGMLEAAYRSCCATGTDQASGIGLASIARGIYSPKFDVRAMFSRLLYELMGGAGIVLLAACANLGTLLLARAAAREREVAVRLSLGASRRRLTAQLLVESGVLAVAGGAAGLVLAHWTLRAVAHRLPAPIVARVAGGLQLNGTLLGFTAAVAACAVLVFGLLPSWRATRTNLVSPLKEGGRLSAAPRSGWLDRGVVVAQVAVALVLVNGAGLFVATLRNLRHVDGGFAVERTVTAGFDTRGTAYESGGIIPVTERLMIRVARLPGVRSAALSLSVPVFGGRELANPIAVAGYTPSPDENMEVRFNPVSPGFFATLGIGLRRGRDFSPEDRPGGQPVAIVNEAFAHQYLRDRNPLGAIVRSLGDADTAVLQVVGVAGDARYDDLREPATPMFYVPLAQFTRLPGIDRIPVAALTVRTGGEGRAVLSSFRNAVLAEAPGLGLYGPETIEASLDEALNRETLTAELATLFGVVALILTGVGLYGVVSYQVARRTREIGVRMALGAASSRMVWMVLKQALTLVTVGVLVGAPLAFGGGRAIAAGLYGLAGQNRIFVLGAGLLLAAVAVAASALPARRAAEVDPMIALRAE